MTPIATRDGKNPASITPAAWLWVAFLAVPPGLTGLALGKLALGINGLAAAMTALLVMQLFYRGALCRMRVLPILSIAALLVAYLTFPRYAETFDVGGRGRETVGLLLTMLVGYALAQQIILGAFNKISIYEYVERAVLLSTTATAIVILAQTWGALGSFDGDFAYAGFQNRIHSGIFCGLGIHLALTRLGERSVGRRALNGGLLLIATAILGGAVLLSLSRSAWAVVLLSLAFNIFGRYNRRRATLMVLLLALFASLVFYYPAAAERFFGEDFSTGRFYLWSQLLPESVDEFLIGRGVGYMWSLSSYDISRYGGFVSQVNESIYAHNDFLFLLVELGVTGVALWVLFGLLQIAEWLRFRAAAVSPPIAVRASSVLVFCVCSMLLLQLVDTVFFGFRNLFYFVTLISVSSALLTSARRGRIIQDQNRRPLP